MRNQKRNEKFFHYSLCLGEQEITQDGLLTGKYELMYSPYKRYRASISPEEGKVYIDKYGLSSSYVRTIVTDKMDCPFDINTRLWVDVKPIKDEEAPMKTQTPFNYKVKRISRSLNQITIQIERVD